MVEPSTTISAAAMRRSRPPFRVSLAALAALTASSADAASRKERPAPVAEERAPREAGEPIMAIVSLKSQKITFYDAEGWISRAPVSTGTTGRETPAGVFAILEKNKDHRSSLYDDAWMPHMQRITWNGIALHGGPLPGYAASHGCVRMPFGFAEAMFAGTRIGMRVIVAPDDAAPVDFSHPALLAPNAEAVAAAPLRSAMLALWGVKAAERASDTKEAAKIAASEAKSLAASVRKLERANIRADAQRASAEKTLAAADRAKTRAVDLAQKAAAKAAELATQLGTAKADPQVTADVVAAASDAASADAAAKKAAALAASEAKQQAALVRKLERDKSRADDQLASAEKALAAADRALARAAELAQESAANAVDLATQLDAAKADAKAKAAAATAAADSKTAAETWKAAAAKAASEGRLLLEPFSIYISRATQKLYVRRNTHKPAPDGGGEVFDSSIEVPITIRDPEKPIGTHILTAIALDSGGLQWTAVTIDDATDATGALDRITIPHDVLAKISPTATPRSSIIVSDEPLSKETNYRTEFVAVLNDHPQGGFLTRRPTVKPVAIPSPVRTTGRFRFFPFFQGN